MSILISIKSYYIKTYLIVAVASGHRLWQTVNIYENVCLTSSYSSFVFKQTDDKICSEYPRYAASSSFSIIIEMHHDVIYFHSCIYSSIESTFEARLWRIITRSSSVSSDQQTILFAIKKKTGSMNLIWLEFLYFCMITYL
uniref:ZP domain-containing protein n=1 Tax=Heterorhabditis bacteriophora TaxID=37862 RepID=A0A1I7WEQ7_HETBA